MASSRPRIRLGGHFNGRWDCTKYLPINVRKTKYEIGIFFLSIHHKNNMLSVKSKLNRKHSYNILVSKNIQPGWRQGARGADLFGKLVSRHSHDSEGHGGAREDDSSRCESCPRTHGRSAASTAPKSATKGARSRFSVGETSARRHRGTIEAETLWRCRWGDISTGQQDVQASRQESIRSSDSDPQATTRTNETNTGEHSLPGNKDLLWRVCKSVWRRIYFSKFILFSKSFEREVENLLTCIKGLISLSFEFTDFLPFRF